MNAQSRHVARLLSQAFRGYANSTAKQASSGAPSGSSMRRHLSNLAVGAAGLGVAVRIVCCCRRCRGAAVSFRPLPLA